LTRDLGNPASQVYGGNYLGEQQLGQNVVSLVAGSF
jgi:hypothetical protein